MIQHSSTKLTAEHNWGYLVLVSSGFLAKHLLIVLILWTRRFDLKEKCVCEHTRLHIQLQGNKIIIVHVYVDIC